MSDDSVLTSLHSDQPAGIDNLGGQSPYYLIQILSSRYGLVNAWLPDKFSMSIEQSWKNLVGGGDIGLLNEISELFTGKIVNNQYLTAKVWTGSNPLMFSLPLHFVARRDSRKEVIRPIKQLMKMSLPVRSGTWQIYPPGPSVKHKAIEATRGTIDTHSDNITLYIGNYIRIPNVYISNVQASFDGLLNKDGEPMSGDVQISCSTLYMPTANEVDTWLPDNKNSITDRPDYSTGRQPGATQTPGAH